MEMKMYKKRIIKNASKQLIVGSALVSFIIGASVGTAKADGPISNGYVVDHFKTVSQSTPITREVCEIVDVPVYGYSNTYGGEASTFDKLGGAIIGGVIGNQFGGGSGKDALTVLGAIAGADVMEKQARKRRYNDPNIVSYRKEQRCSTEVSYEREEVRMYSHSTVTFTDESGNPREVRFKR